VKRYYGFANARNDTRRETSDVRDTIGGGALKPRTRSRRTLRSIVCFVPCDIAA
jgi:hypothetical protein